MPMVVAPWVRGLDGYCAWIRGVIDSAGELQFPLTGNPHFEDGPLRVTAGGVEIPMLVVQSHRLLFHGRTDYVLDFSFKVSETPNGFEYDQHSERYRLATSGGQQVWRYENHPGHPDIAGNLWHMHGGPYGHRAPCDEVDLDDVVQQALRDI